MFAKTPFKIHIPFLRICDLTWGINGFRFLMRVVFNNQEYSAFFVNIAEKFLSNL